jgi:hypothetical protein
MQDLFNQPLDDNEKVTVKVRFAFQREANAICFRRFAEYKSHGYILVC